MFEIDVVRVTKFSINGPSQPSMTFIVDTITKGINSTLKNTEQKNIKVK